MLFFCNVANVMCFVCDIIRIPIIFEGDLAHVAACHLKKNDHIHISGQLFADAPPSTTPQTPVNIQVMHYGAFVYIILRQQATWILSFATYHLDLFLHRYLVTK